MHNASNQFIISLSPDMLSAAIVRRGRVKQAEQIALDPGEWGKLWDDGLMGLDQPLRQLISRFPARGHAQATLIYRSPTVTQQVYTFDHIQSAAREAGVSKIRESIGYTDPIETSILYAHDKGEGTTTLLVYSEREEQLRSLYAWLNRSNVRVKSLLPTCVATISAAGEIALAAAPDTAVFYLGPDVSVMAYATSSGIHLIRSAEIGYRKLIEGYAQSIKAGLECDPNDSQQSNAVSNVNLASEALGMLIEHGIPVQSVEVNGVDLRSTVLPILAPVLQRFCIEIKQTFRFGLNGVEMPKNLMLCGPGAVIPHMGKSISQHIEMQIQVDPRGESFAPADAFGRGSLEWSMIESNTTPEGLLPAIARDARMSSTLTRSLVAGAVLAVAVMGTEYGTTTLERQKISRQMSQDTARVDAVDAFNEQLVSASKMSNTISDVSELISDTVGSIPEWQFFLAGLAEVSSDSIRMQEVGGQSANGVISVDINGVAVSESEKESGKALNRFVAAVKTIQGVSQVTLGLTSRISVDDDLWGRQFTMKVELDQVPLPHKALVHVADAGTAWETP